MKSCKFNLSSQCARVIGVPSTILVVTHLQACIETKLIIMYLSWFYYLKLIIVVSCKVTKKLKPIIVHVMVFKMTLLISPLHTSQYYVILLFHVDRVSQARNLSLEIASHCDMLHMLGSWSMSDVGHLIIIFYVGPCF